MPESKSCEKLLLPRLTAMKNVHQYEFGKNGKTCPKLTKKNSGIMQLQRKKGGRPAAKPPTTTISKIISLLSDEPGFALLVVSIRPR